MSKPTKNTYDKVALMLTAGAVALVLIIAFGAFGRSFYLAVVTHEDYPISDSSTQLLTALGSALVGGAVGFISGSNKEKNDSISKEGNPCCYCSTASGNSTLA